jgi:hypothetical protein
MTLSTRRDAPSISPYYHNNIFITYFSLTVMHKQKHYKRWVLVCSYTHPVILAMHANSARSVALKNNSMFYISSLLETICQCTNCFTLVHDKHNTRIDSRRLELEWASFERIVIRIQKKRVSFFSYSVSHAVMIRPESVILLVGKHAAKSVVSAPY